MKSTKLCNNLKQHALAFSLFFPLEKAKKQKSNCSKRRNDEITKSDELEDDVEYIDGMHSLYTTSFSLLFAGLDGSIFSNTF